MAVYAVPLRREYTPQEYLEQEREATFKSEYLEGGIYAMAGSSPEQSAITANVMGILVPQLWGTSCRAYSSDMKIGVSSERLFSYPDLSLVCGEPQFRDTERDVLTNPKVILEVLSPLTEAFDRGLKFLRYQLLSTLTDYLRIAQTEPRIDHFARQSDHQWLLTILTGLEASLTIASIGCTLPLNRIYDRIAFE